MISPARAWPGLAIGFGIFGFAFHPGPSPSTANLIIYGDTHGYLAPCGCTNPMSGGISRAATVISELSRQTNGDSTFVLEGALVSGAGRQDELKAECYAEAAGVEKAIAVAYGVEEAALGPGIELEMSSLSNGVLLQSQVSSSNPDAPKATVRSGAFLLGSVTESPKTFGRQLGMAASSEADGVRMLLAEASGDDLPILFIDGDQAQAKALAERYPALAAIVYRSTSDPLGKPVRVGTTLLVTTGYHGKNVLDLSFEGKALVHYAAVPLGPDVADDSYVNRIYADYLRRVGEDHLLDKLPRYHTAAYAGSQACQKCHEKAYRIWENSGHDHAYRDLTAHGHGLDPDCVSCHVVGLASTAGFKSLATTRAFANVGCESCHGPAQSHVRDPRKFLLHRVTAKTCETCHTPDNSPEFDFPSFWQKIQH